MVAFFFGNSSDFCGERECIGEILERKVARYHFAVRPESPPGNLLHQVFRVLLKEGHAIALARDTVFCDEVHAAIVPRTYDGIMPTASLPHTFRERCGGLETSHYLHT